MASSSVAFSELATYFSQFAAIPNHEWDVFALQITQQRYPKGKSLLSVGDSSDFFGYILSGLLRLVTFTPEGKSYIRCFTAEGELVCPIASALAGAPSAVSIEALEDTSILRFKYTDLTASYLRHPAWEQLGRRLLEQCLLEHEQRGYELLVYDAEQRYDLFLQRFAKLKDRLSQADIAAYLGITPVSLSRLLRTRRS